MISSSSPGAGSLVVVDQHKKSSLCSVNTEFQDANILPDLNIAHVPSSSDEEQQRDGDGDGDRRFLLDKRGDGATVESNKGVGNHGEASDGNHEYGDRGSAREQGDELQRPAMAVTVSEMPAPSWLPEGWVSESRIRADGHKDKYYIESYTGRRFRSKVEVFKYLETGLPPARWKRKGKGFDAGSNDKLDDPASFEQQQQRDAIFGSAGAGFRVSTSASDTFKASFDSLRGSATINGITPPPFSMQRGSLDVDEQATKKPVFFDYWSSTLGSGSAPPRSSSSWTENYKLGNAFVNGPSPPSTAPSFGSKTESSTTPHWLDRILNKPPPAAIAQPGYSFGLTGGFVQSPLHYLQNAGAFQNNWLNLKPPTAINLSDYDVPWKSRSWFDRREPDRFDSRGGGINLNHEPEEEARGQYHRHQAADRQEYSRRTNSSSLESLWKKAVPITLEHREYVAYSNGSNAGAAAAAAARPSKASGSHQQHHNQHQHQHHQLHQHQHQQHQHQHQHQNQHQHQHPHHPQQQRESGVKRSGAKVDRYQEKRRLERLGTRLCEQGLARLVHELKDRGRGIDLN